MHAAFPIIHPDPCRGHDVRVVPAVLKNPAPGAGCYPASVNLATEQAQIEADAAVTAAQLFKAIQRADTASERV